MRNWCFCGNEAGADARGKATVMRQIKDGKKKALEFDKNYANCEESTGGDVNWRLKATAFGTSEAEASVVPFLLRLCPLWREYRGPGIRPRRNKQRAVCCGHRRLEGAPSPCIFGSQVALFPSLTSVASRCLHSHGVLLTTAPHLAAVARASRPSSGLPRQTTLRPRGAASTSLASF